MGIQISWSLIFSLDELGRVARYLNTMPGGSKGKLTPASSLVCFQAAGLAQAQGLD